MVQQPLPTVDPTRTEFGFNRSVCACPDCVRNCRFLPGYLIPADLQRVAAHLPRSVDLFAWSRQHLLASPGAKVVLRRGRFFRIPTLVPARRPDGACRFLTADDCCVIHPVAPFGCAFFDTHQTREESDARSKRGLQAVLEAWQNGDVYAQVWTMLAEAGLTAPPPEVCRAQMRQADKPSLKRERRTMTDPTEPIRRAQLAEINAAPGSRESLEARYGQVWNTEELARDFEVTGFLAPYVVVRRKADSQVGSLAFQHHPRFYFGFEADRR